MKRYFKAVAFAAPFVLSSSALASGPLTTGDELILTSTSVVITGEGFPPGGGPGYDNLMGYVDPSSNALVPVAHNQSTDADVHNSVTLTGLTVGSELQLFLTNPNGDTFFTGPAGRNPDGDVHAYIAKQTDGSFNVCFEDLLGPNSDWNYGDGMLNIRAASVPEPGPVGLASFATLGAFLFARRRKA